MRTLAPLFGVLMLIALIIKLIWWILGAAALYVLFRVARSSTVGSFKVTTAESTVSIRWPTSSVSGVDQYRLDAGR
jgi:hypothetical protein